jgi:Zn finger protein HypA/HybF involved in hydrogenase expression
MLLIVIAVVLCLWAVALVWIQQKQNREQRDYDAEIERCGRWPCPNCAKPLRGGLTVFYGRGDAGSDDKGDAFVSHAVIVCRHCSFLNRFDSNGRPRFGAGVYFNHEEELREEERWKRIAHEMSCPRCGASFETWSGRVWGCPEKPPELRAPIMHCPNCQAESWVVEEPKGPRIVGVCHGDEWLRPLELPAS